MWKTFDKSFTPPPPPPLTPVKAVDSDELKKFKKAKRKIQRSLRKLSPEIRAAYTAPLRLLNERIKKLTQKTVKPGTRP